MSDQIFLHLFSAELSGQSLLAFLGLVFLIILMPYVAGYIGKILQREHLKTEIIFRIASFLVSSSVAIFFVQLYLPLPADWQENQIIPVLVSIASLAVGILIWKSSYTIGQGRAAQNAADRQDLARIIVENDIKPNIRDAADDIVNKVSSRIDSFEENFLEVKKLVESENAYTQSRMQDWYEYILNAIASSSSTITAELKTDLKNFEEQLCPELGIQKTRSDEPDNIDSEEQSPEERRIKGIQARRTGEEVQSEVYAMVRMNASHGEEVVCSYEQGEPDIIITRNDKLADVIAVKSYTLTVTDKKGMRNVRGQKVAVSFCPIKDAKAEVEYAKNHGLGHIHLIAVNIATRKMIFDGTVEFEQTITLRDLKEDQ